MMASRVVGIAGGIGSGKSVVSRICRLKGYEVYDCDFEARRLMESSREIKDGLQDIFGDEVINSDTGEIRRDKIASIVFSNSFFLRKLNALVHKEVKSDIGKKLEKNAGKTFFIESAILRSSGLEALCDEIWLVESSVEERVNRVIDRNGMDREEVLARIRTQAGESEFPDSGKIRVIANGEDSRVLERVNQLLNSIEEKTI